MLAICIGHSRRGDLGAVSIGGVSEHPFNSLVARELLDLCENDGIPAVIVDDYEFSGYTSAITWLARYLRRRRATVALELHFNSSSEASSHGVEYLYWPSSSNGRRLATCLADAHHDIVPGATLRHDDTGLLPRGSGNGSQFLRKTHCPAVICEPFFGSNPDEWALYASDPSILARIYYEAYRSYRAGK